MNKDIVKKITEIVQAYLDGKEIEFHSPILNKWKPASMTNISSLIKNVDNYRIKPKVKYRPFKNLKECLEEMQAHFPYGWIKSDEDTHRLITLLGEDRIEIGNQEVDWTYEKVFRYFTFIDDTPFGVKEEE